MARRLIALAGLLCVLLHAGIAVLHQSMPVRGFATEVAGASDKAAVELAAALSASLCTPSGRQGGHNLPGSPSAPDHREIPCPVCCCPAATAMLAPIGARCLLPHVANVRERVIWQARQIEMRARLSERPPVRAPPLVA